MAEYEYLPARILRPLIGRTVRPIYMDGWDEDDPGVLLKFTATHLLINRRWVAKNSIAQLQLVRGDK